MSVESRLDVIEKRLNEVTLGFLCHQSIAETAKRLSALAAPHPDEVCEADADAVELHRLRREVEMAHEHFTKAGIPTGGEAPGAYSVNERAALMAYQLASRPVTPSCARHAGPDCAGCAGDREVERLRGEIATTREELSAVNGLVKWHIDVIEECHALIGSPAITPLQKRVAALIASHAALTAERDGLRGERDEALSRAADARSEHCKDCCCARSWSALGVTAYTGKSIVEHIEELIADRDAQRARADSAEAKCVEYQEAGRRGISRVTGDFLGEVESLRASLARCRGLIEQAVALIEGAVPSPKIRDLLQAGNWMTQHDSFLSHARALLSSPEAPSEAGIPGLTRDEVNALPEKVRRFVHDLETRCDPSSDIRNLAVARDQVEQLGNSVEDLRKQCHEVDKTNEGLRLTLASGRTEADRLRAALAEGKWLVERSKYDHLSVLMQRSYHEDKAEYLRHRAAFLVPT